MTSRMTQAMISTLSDFSRCVLPLVEADSSQPAFVRFVQEMVEGADPVKPKSKKKKSQNPAKKATPAMTQIEKEEFVKDAVRARLQRGSTATCQ